MNDHAVDQSVRTSDSIGKLAEALAQAQGEFPEIKKNKIADAGTYKYKYADIADVLAAVRPALSKHGLALSQPTIVEGGTIFLRTRLMHKSGEWLESDYPVAAYAQQNHQKMGAALTYARRYAGCAVLGVAAEEDVDAAGNAAMADAKTSQQRQSSRREPPTVIQSGTKPLPPVAGAKPADKAFYLTDRYGQPELEPLDEASFVAAFMRELSDCQVYAAVGPMMKANAEQMEKLSAESNAKISDAYDRRAKELRRQTHSDQAEA